MNKLGMVLGIAAVVAIAGCKDPNWNRRTHKNDVKDTSTKVAPTPVAGDPAADVSAARSGDVAPTPVVVEDNSCKCAPGTVHELPCGCGGVDCKCVVVKTDAAASKPTTAPEPEFTTYIVQRGDYPAKISKKDNITIGAIKTANGLKDDKIRIGQKLKLPGKVEVGEQTVPAGAFKAPVKKVYAPYSGATKEYVVKNGDTLGAIAYGNGINIRQLKELNGLSGDGIRIGQKLKIPAVKVARPAAKVQPVKKAEVKAEKAAPADAKKEAAPKVDKSVEEALAQVEEKTEKKDEAPAANESAPVVDEPSDALTYTVQEGEDLADVSIRWGVSAAAVRELNNLGENDKLKAGQVLRLPADAQQN